MSFLAKIFVEREERWLLNLRHSFFKDKDKTGLPHPQIKGGSLEFELECSQNDSLWRDWMVSHLMRNGYIRFYKRDGMGKFFDIEFWDCYMLKLCETFRSDGPEPYSMKISLSPGIFRMGDVVFERPWKVSEPFRNTTPVSFGAEPEEVVPRITGAVVNTEKFSDDNHCPNRYWLNKLGLNAKEEMGFFNGIEIAFVIEGEFGSRYKAVISRTIVARKITVGKENQIENKKDYSLNDPISKGNLQLTPLNGMIYSIDAPGVYDMDLERFHNIINYRMVANFEEKAQLFEITSNNAVGPPILQNWHTVLEINRDETHFKYNYGKSKIGTGHIELF